MLHCTLACGVPEGAAPRVAVPAHAARAVSTCGSTHWTLCTSRVLQMCARSRRSTLHPQHRSPDASASRAMVRAVALSCTSPKSGMTLAQGASPACWCLGGMSAGMMVTPPEPYTGARCAPTRVPSAPRRGAYVRHALVAVQASCQRGQGLLVHGKLWTYHKRHEARAPGPRRAAERWAPSLAVCTNRTHLPRP
jgi:hypothetical protein